MFWKVFGWMGWVLRVLRFEWLEIGYDITAGMSSLTCLQLG